MWELEDSFVDGSLEIPGRGRDESNNGEEHNMALVEKQPELARKRYRKRSILNCKQIAKWKSWELNWLVRHSLEMTS